ncbi:DUF4184 family protein [Nocardioides sp. ChNu-153]|uniref:DUF4184 family protein n=1 Tax=unclassified Nocardioides TaxID=2615069 RepID=UPI002406E5DD|nr:MULTISPECIES: DUF4184 family protein [unclassified Nocardioides]MDF9716649.1 DUF4184 family protein [Nocardioides sp. ChNu-99]MDN7123062.1 DUF4184 family protein [Nocardioides sp. ChNu-153]
MPFTLAHPAAVLPLLRPPFVAAALVAGTIAPDVPYFVRASGVGVSAQSWYEPLTNATTTHDVRGAVVVALPVALLLWVGWLVARPALAWATGAGTGSGGPRRRSRVTTAGWVVVSAALGVATHLAWDALTDLARWLQHVSTVVGLLAVLGYVVLRRPRAALAPPYRRRVLTALGLLVTAALVGAALAVRALDGGVDGGTGGPEALLTAAVKGGGAAAAGALVLLVAGWWLARATPAGRGRPAPGA